MSLPLFFEGTKLEGEGSKLLNEPSMRTRIERGRGKLLDSSIAMPVKSGNIGTSEG